MLFKKFSTVLDIQLPAGIWKCTHPDGHALKNNWSGHKLQAIHPSRQVSTYMIRGSGHTPSPQGMQLGQHAPGAVAHFSLFTKFSTRHSTTSKKCTYPDGQNLKNDWSKLQAMHPSRQVGTYSTESGHMNPHFL